MKAKLFNQLSFAFLFVTFITVSVFAQKYQANWESLDKRPTPEWFGKAKFGIFIHWGLYSVPSWATNSYADGFGSNYAEWYWQRLFAPNLKIHKEFVDFHNRVYGKDFVYQQFAPKFTAELFEPEKWAKIFKSSGAKYVVLTSKHHEGFTLWNAPQSWNWNSVDIGPKRDLAGDLSKAVKNEGLRMGFYYSLFEWFNPQYKSDVNGYVAQRMLPQMKDLVTKYKPDIIWADGDWEHPAKIWRTEEFSAWLFNESVSKDEVVINDRLGSDTKSQHGSFQTSEYGAGNVSGNKPWEETRGIGQSFGYNRNENLEQYSTSQELIHELISVVARGGNLLLNIGPAADGTIPVIMQQRLQDIGDWLNINGEAIYETKIWEKAPKVTKETNLFFTQKGNSVYAITTKWKNEIEIKNIEKPKNVTMLGFNGKIDYVYKNNILTIKMPLLTPDIIPCQYAWALKIDL
ncbi:MAG TPA: alpha-L-fucosidase [Pyrinomonadaceae bacterium]|nr:alpha-L-fucosidase [Pyrinomonadaceae bacterium]